AFIMAAYSVRPSWQVVFLPLLIVPTITAALGPGYILASLTVFYRDFRYTIPFLLQILFYLSPVIYPVSLLPARYQWVIALNPMCGLIDAYRSAILGTPWKPGALALSTVINLALFLLALYYFRRTERRFADIA